MAGRERVTAAPATTVPPPWLAGQTADEVEAWDHLQQQQQQQQTAVGEFEPLPDSPTGASRQQTAAGKGPDQQQQQQHGGVFDSEQQPVGLASKKTVQLDAPKVAAREKPPASAAVTTTKGPAPGTAHVHLIGEITGAVGLGPGPLYCTWQLVYDTRLWSITGGLDKGRTHASSPLLSEDGSVSGVVWECPVDVLLTTTSMQHWPSIVFKLFHRSIWLGRDEFVGYSLCSLPNTPGCHHVSCPVWVAAEGRSSMQKELTKFFTGLHPQLVDESFIADLEQRYEQGQYLHTLTCSSSSGSSCMQDSMPYGRSVLCTGGPGGSAAAGGGGGGSGASSTSAALARAHCSSISTASSGAAAVVGSGICLRLHVLTRGLQQLGSRLRGDAASGAESIGHCLERLHSSVGKMRRQHHQQHGKPGRLEGLVGGGAGGSGDDDSDDDSQAEAEEESQGVKLVRQGRAARLDAVHRQLFGGDKDRDRDRDRDQQQQQQQRPPSSSSAGSPARRFAAADGGAVNSSISSQAGGSSSVDAGATTAGSVGRFRPLAGSSAGGSPVRRFGGDSNTLTAAATATGGAMTSSGSSPLRSREAPGATGSNTNRWAGRFASPKD